MSPAQIPDPESCERKENSCHVYHCFEAVIMHSNRELHSFLRVPITKPQTLRRLKAVNLYCFTVPRVRSSKLRCWQGQALSEGLGKISSYAFSLSLWCCWRSLGILGLYTHLQSLLSYDISPLCLHMAFSSLRVSPPLTREKSFLNFGFMARLAAY